MSIEREFERKVFDIKAKNYINIINRLKDFVIDCELSTTGLLLQPQEALDKAHEVFCVAKQNGVLDELNNVIED